MSVNMSVREKLKTIIAEQLDVETVRVTSEATFMQDLGADSLDLTELVMEMEEAFGIEIPDSDLETIKTVGDAERYVEAKGGKVPEA